MMKAARYHENGTDYSLVRLEDVPIPHPTANCAVVKVSYAAINPIDDLVFKGYLKGAGWHMKFPFTMGYDFAGVITALPLTATDPKIHIGDTVFAVNWGHASHNGATEEEHEGGAFAEYILIPLHKLSKVPSGLGLDLAAACALVGTTAHQALFETAKLKAGDKVLILGGSSSVGQLAIQLAHLRGVTVFTTASSRNLDLVGQFKPHMIINYQEQDWATVPEVKGVDCVFDTIGVSGDFEKSKSVLKPTGKFVTIASQEAGHNPAGHPPLTFAAFMGLWNDPAVQDYLAANIVSGHLKVLIDETFPFTTEGVHAILNKVAGGKSQGKNIIKF